jgi:hypothetical protein
MDISQTETGETILESDKGFAYVKDNKVMYNRWFQRELDSETIKSIKTVDDRFGSEVSEWLLASQIPLEKILKIDDAIVDTLYPTKCVPSLFLLNRFDDLSPKYSKDKCQDLVLTYDKIRFSEKDDFSLWQMLDHLSGESSEGLFNLMIECYDKCPNLMKMTEKYQASRTCHETRDSLLRSTLDFLLTCKALQEE